MDPAIIPQPTGNPILDNPTLKAAFMASQGGAQQPPQPQGATMPPAGQQPPAQISLPDAPMPTLAPAKQPVVFGPFGQKSGPVAQRGTQEGDKQERERELSTGSGLSQIHSRIESAMPNHPVLGKVLGIGAQGLATLGDIGLRTVSPIAESMIPGTAGHHAAQLRQVNQALTQDETNAEKEAQTASLQQEGDLREQQARAAELTPATDEESAALGVPPGTMLNAASRAALAKQGGINKTKTETTTQTNATKDDIAAINILSKEKIAALKPEQRDDHAIRIMELPPEQRTQQDNAYLAAYSRYVDMTKTQPGVARAAAFGAFRPVQTIGPDGDVHYDFAGSAIKHGEASPGSMNFRTAMKMAQFMSSGKGGQTLTAYRTASDHLDLLGKATDALDNGDIQMFNIVGNEIAKQTGQPAPTNFDAVKAMLAGELANVSKTTGATDPEIKTMQESITRADSPEQLKGVIETNQNLMDQKAQELFQQYQSGMQGKPNLTKPKTGGNQPAQGGAPQRPASVPAGYNWNPQGNGGKGSWQPPKQ